MLLNRCIAFKHELVNVSTGYVREINVRIVKLMIKLKNKLSMRTVHRVFVWRVKLSVNLTSSQMVVFSNFG